MDDDKKMLVNFLAKLEKHRYSYCFPSGIRNIASGQFYWSLSLGWGQSNLNSEASQVTELMVPLHVY